MRLPGIRASVPVIVLALLAVLTPVQASAAAPAGTFPHQDFSHPLVMKEAADKLAAAPASRSSRGARPLSLQQRTSQAGLSSPAPMPEVFGFVYMNSGISDPSVGYPSWNFNLLTTVAIFGIHVNYGDGSLSGTDVSTWQSSLITNFISYAHQRGTKVVATVIMQDFSGAGGSPMCQALEHRATTVAQIAQQVAADNVEGLNVDYEGLNGTCSNGQTARSMMTSLVQQLRAALPASYLSVDTYGASADDPLNFFDVVAIAASADAEMVMAYDQDFSNYSYPPLNCTSYCLNPVGALNAYHYNDTSEMSQYSAAVPASKVILGIPYYGRGAAVGSRAANQYPITCNSPTGSQSGTWNPTYLQSTGYQSDPDNSAYVAGRDVHDGSERYDTWQSGHPQCLEEMYWDDSASLGAKYDLVRADSLRGIGIWTLPYGGGASELWSTIAMRLYNLPGVPGNVSGCAGNASASVSWTAAPSPVSPVTGYRVTVNPGGQVQNFGATTTFATVAGLTPGTPYTISVQAVNAFGVGVSSTASVTPAGNAPTFTSYLTWYDRASQGMNVDNVHIVNTGTSSATGCVTIAGLAIAAFTAPAGAETIASFPAGTIGGPVVITVNSGPAVIASQRVTYNQSFNEVRAQPAGDAATDLYFNWFDKQSQGMYQDNIHLVNPGTSAAAVTVTLGAQSTSTSVSAGGEAYVTFPAGTIGGPVHVHVTGGPAVLASQRVTYLGSFNEVLGASAAAAATTSYFTWFDKQSPGMYQDNVHLLNPGASPAAGSVSFSKSDGSGTLTQSFLVQPGAEQLVTFAAGTAQIGGPVVVKVTSGPGLIASQRVTYFQSFNEVSAVSTGATSATFAWFDKQSPGMYQDNIHVINPGSQTAAVSVAIPGCAPQTGSVPVGGEQFFTCTGGFGGPVTVTVTGGPGVISSQRVTYFQSFNEVPAAT